MIESGRRVSTAVRLPEELYEQLVQQAELRDVSINFLVIRAVTKYLQTAPDPFTMKAERVVDEYLADPSPRTFVHPVGDDEVPDPAVGRPGDLAVDETLMVVFVRGPEWWWQASDEESAVFFEGVNGIPVYPLATHNRVNPKGESS